MIRGANAATKESQMRNQSPEILHRFFGVPWGCSAGVGVKANTEGRITTPSQHLLFAWHFIILLPLHNTFGSYDDPDLADVEIEAGEVK